MDWKKLAINVALAAFWAGLAAWQVSGGEFSKAAVVAVVVAAVRGAVGYLASLVNKPVPVDV